MVIAKVYAGPNRRRGGVARLPLALAVLGVAAITFATLCPIGLRPHLASADEERFGAYFVLGVLIALTSPRRWLRAVGMIVVLALVLEAGQLLIPGRDAAISDAVIKALGGVVGALAVQLGFPLRRLLARRIPPIAQVDRPAV